MGYAGMLVLRALLVKFWVFRNPSSVCLTILFFTPACRCSLMTTTNISNTPEGEVAHKPVQCVWLKLQPHELICKHCGQRLHSNDWHIRTIKQINRSTNFSIILL